MLKQTQVIAEILTKKIQAMEVLTRIILFLFILTIGYVGTVLLSRTNSIILRVIFGFFFYVCLFRFCWHIFTVPLDSTSTSQSPNSSEQSSPTSSPNALSSIEMLSEEDLAKGISRMDNDKYSSRRFITRKGCLDEIKEKTNSANYSDDYDILSNCRKNEKYCSMIYLLGEKNSELNRGAWLYGRKQQCNKYGWYGGTEHSGDGQGVQTTRLFDE